jgi:hypothetical protein
MRFVGIDIGAERHVVAIVGEDGAVLTAATPFQEDVEGYRQLRAVMGTPPTRWSRWRPQGITGKISLRIWSLKALPWRCSIRCGPIGLAPKIWRVRRRIASMRC